MKYYKIIIAIFIIFYLEITYSNLKKIKSINNKYYYTQKNNALEASKILILLEKFINKLSYYLIKENSNNVFLIKQLKKNIIISEIPKKHNHYISYISNKKYIYICLRKNNNIFEKNLNGLYFILIHELAHLITKKYGHHKEYWNNYKLVLQTAIKHNLYKYKNYNNNPIYICKNKIINSNI